MRDAADPGLASVLAVEDGATIGVALVRRRFAVSAELHLLAVEPGRHRMGVGRALVERVAADLAADGCGWLTVRTVGPS